MEKRRGRVKKSYLPFHYMDSELLALLAFEDATVATKGEN